MLQIDSREVYSRTGKSSLSERACEGTKCGKLREVLKIVRGKLLWKASDGCYSGVLRPRILSMMLTLHR